MTSASAPRPPVSELRVERHAHGIAVLTFDRAERRHAMSVAMTSQWVAAMAELAADSELRAVVVTGSGGVFSAGGDLAWLASGPTDVPALRIRMERFYRDWLGIRSLPVPTIAAIAGPAVGAGLALALACDLRVVGQDATLSAPFTSLGLHPGMASTWSLPAIAGPALARDLLYTGRVLTGAEATDAGLASRCVPGADVLTAALDLAADIARRSPAATRSTVAALGAAVVGDVEAAIRSEALAQAVTLADPQVRARLAAGAAATQERTAGPAEPHG